MCARITKINEGFICCHCGEEVAPAEKTCRNHCPRCLWSLHVDDSLPGDRSSDCGGEMEPVQVERSGKGYRVVHRCTVCGCIKKNQVVKDDDWERVIELCHLGRIV